MKYCLVFHSLVSSKKTKRICAVGNIGTVQRVFAFAVVKSFCGATSRFCVLRYDEPYNCLWKFISIPDI